MSCELLDNKDSYKEQIRRIQVLITEITEKGVSIQVQEERNKKSIEAYFSKQRKQIKEGRVSSQRAYGYYKTISNSGLIPPQFMDQKK